MAEFEIAMDGKVVGKATVERQGLYCRFSCRCVFPDKGIHTIWVCWDGGSRKLGVCVPNGRDYCLNTSVPLKYIPDKRLTFAVDYTEKKQDDFYAVDAERPFDPIDKLSRAQFDVRDGKPGLIIPN